MDILNLHENKVCTPQVVTWVYEEFVRDLRPGISHDDVTRSFTERQKHIIPLTYIGMVHGECVGTVSLVRNDLKARGDLTPWLADLYIAKPFRGNGYAQQLISKACATSRELGFRKLYLRTESAATYYARSGWKKIDEIIDEFHLFTEVFEKEL